MFVQNVDESLRGYLTKVSPHNLSVLFLDLEISRNSTSEIIGGRQLAGLYLVLKFYLTGNTDSEVTVRL
jgi:hypothetical protein